MTRDRQIEALDHLLQQASQAHHQAFVEMDGEDAEWPLWYANYLRDDLNQILKASFTISELVYHLQQVTRVHEAEAPDISWAEYAANYFVHITRS